jgi:hypothetical protein
MKNVLIALSLVLSTSFVYADATKKEDKPPVTAQKKPEVKKPCKEGQTAEKDKCHEVKKIEKKK